MEGGGHTTTAVNTQIPPVAKGFAGDGMKFKLNCPGPVRKNVLQEAAQSARGAKATRR